MTGLYIIQKNYAKRQDIGQTNGKIIIIIIKKGQQCKAGRE